MGYAASKSAYTNIPLAVQHQGAQKHLNIQTHVSWGTDHRQIRIYRFWIPITSPGCSCHQGHCCAGRRMKIKRIEISESGDVAFVTQPSQYSCWHEWKYPSLLASCHWDKTGFARTRGERVESMYSNQSLLSKKSRRLRFLLWNGIKGLLRSDVRNMAE